MLSRPAADLQHAATVREMAAQHGEDGFAVALAGRRVGFIPHQPSVAGAVGRCKFRFGIRVCRGRRSQAAF
jgi:hypothetical protein